MPLRVSGTADQLPQHFKHISLLYVLELDVRFSRRGPAARVSETATGTST